MLIQNFEELSKINKFDEREGKTLLGYWRMYYRGGWGGRLLSTNPKNPFEVLLNQEEKEILQRIVDYICEKAPKGMNWEFEDLIKSTFKSSKNGRYHCFYMGTNLNYLVEFVTEYGNDDYPVRIYVYRDNE